MGAYFIKESQGLLPWLFHGLKIILVRVLQLLDWKFPFVLLLILLFLLFLRFLFGSLVRGIHAHPELFRLFQIILHCVQYIFLLG